MSAYDVDVLIAYLETSGVRVWIDGGWCVDILLSRQTRKHDDLDLAVSRADEPRLRERLAREGFLPEARPGTKAWNYLLVDRRGRRVDVHVFEHDEDGNCVYGIPYPPDALTGRSYFSTGEFDCIAPEWMFRFKTSYLPADKDVADVHALAEAFGFEIPESWAGPRP